MKKKITKILCVTVAVALVICCCCFSASAATINAGTGSQVYVGDTNAGPIVNGNKNADGSYWINYYGGRTYMDIGLLFPVDLVINRGDTVSWGAFYASFYFSLSSTEHYSIMLGLMDEDYAFYPLEEEDFTSKYGSYGKQFKGGSSQFTEDVNVKYICILLYGNYGQSSAGTFGWQPYTFKLSSADENTIMLEGMLSEQQQTNELLGDITADKYTPPSGDEEIGNLNQTEEELLGSSEEGMNQAKLLFSNFNLAQFGQSMLGVISIVNTFVDGMPWLSEIIIISLSIGILGFLFGIVNLVVGRMNYNHEYTRIYNFYYPKSSSKKGGG